MYITKIRIKNFKRFSDWFQLDLSSNVNIIVGINEIGKSTIIEAVNLALTGFYQGKYVRNDINQYLFNKTEVDKYLLSIKEGTPIEPPSVEIEVFFDDCPSMKGNHNSQTIEACGLYYKICFDESYQSEYNSLLELHDMTTLPVEYYHVVWRSFHREDITARSIPYKASLIDTSTQYQTASDMYVSHIVRNKLDEKDKINITQSYRKAQQIFMTDDAIVGINRKLADLAQIDGEDISLSVDLSSKRAWSTLSESHMQPRTILTVIILLLYFVRLITLM